MLFIWVPIAVICAYLVYNRFLHPLRRVPGPFLASLSPLWIVYQTYYRRRPRLDVKLHEKYGSVVRISPDEVIFSNADYFRAVYGAGTKFKKGRFYEAPTDRSQPNNWEKLDMLTEKDTEKLRIQKRFSGPIYSENNARRHEHYLDNNLNRMLKRFATLTDKSLDLYTEFEYFIEDSMTEFTFGSPYGALEAGTDGGHMASMDKMWAWWGWIGQMPWLNEIDKRFAPWAIIFSDLVPKSINLPIFPYVVGQIMAYDKAIAEKKDAPSCLLSDFRQLTKERPEFRQGWGTHLSVTNLGAGVDTMSWTMASFVVGIGQNPSVAAKMRSEIAAAIASGEISKSKPVSYDVAARLPYFQACIQECMRIWPNVAMALPRLVPDEGMTIDGYDIPGGYTVGMNSKVLGLNEKVFGDRPKEFRPERWLEADKQSKDSMVTRNLAFGGPSRKCPGMHLAMFTVSKALATLYANFDIEILNELDGNPGPGGHVWREYGSFPTKWHGLEIKLTSR